MVKRIVLYSKELGEKYCIAATDQDYHTKYGFFKASDLKKTGTMITTNKGKEFAVLDAGFLDTYEKMKRGAQIITLKDIGYIIANTALSKDSKVLDAGSGSGALCCFLTQVAKEVVSYDIREDHLKIVEHNKKLLNIKNLTLKHKDIYEGIDEKECDVIIFDLAEPWNAVAHASKALKVGGYLVNYSPTIPQMMDFNAEIEKNDEWIHLKTVESIQREWDVKGRKVRPKSTTINHTGFISFVRKIA